MVIIGPMDKSEKDEWLPRLFGLLHENMKTIAPGELPFDQEQKAYCDNVSRALEKPPRQILLCLEDGALAGFVQYYTRGELLMVEEVQLRRDHQRSLLLRRIVKILAQTLPGEICRVEAYADRRNLRSRALMEKLGMKLLPGEEESPYVHLRGSAGEIRQAFRLEEKPCDKEV